MITLISFLIVTNAVGMVVNHTTKANLSNELQFSRAALWSQSVEKRARGPPHVMRLFLTGDVMLGRGMDQILPKPCPPRIFEHSIKAARRYVELAEDAHGKLPLDRNLQYLWGSTLPELEIMKPVARIINLETAVTRSGNPWKGKNIHYRVSPENAETLRELNPNGTLVTTLANNHALDWGRRGLEDSLHTLKKLGIAVAGAGRDADEAASPAVVRVSQHHRVLVFGLGHKSSKIPEGWKADSTHSGINTAEFTKQDLQRFAEQVKKFRRRGDIVVASVHWGGNWGFEIPEEQQAFARQLVDVADVDIVHGHSSHHFKGLELYKERLLMYGAGDYLNDYEGIKGGHNHQKFKSNIGFMYFVDYDVSNRRVAQLILTPTQLRNFRVEAPTEMDLQWALRTLQRECKKFALRVEVDKSSRHLQIFSEDSRKSIKDAK